MYIDSELGYVIELNITTNLNEKLVFYLTNDFTWADSNYGLSEVHIFKNNDIADNICKGVHRNIDLITHYVTIDTPWVVYTDPFFQGHGFEHDNKMNQFFLNALKGFVQNRHDKEPGERDVQINETLYVDCTTSTIGVFKFADIQQEFTILELIEGTIINGRLTTIVVNIGNHSPRGTYVYTLPL